jgi:hypothetical protein
MTRFDASAWAGIWPFTMHAPVSLADLVADLKAAGITGASISPLNAVLTPEPMTANVALLTEAAQFADESFNLRVAPILNPSLPGWERDLSMLLDSHRAAIGAIKIVPSYHGYDVDGPNATALARAVSGAGLGLCVQIRMLDERAHHPLMKVPAVPIEGIARLAAALQTGRLLACGVFQSELAGIAGSPNVSAELSSVESGDTLTNALAVMGADRVLLGTHAPIYYPAAGVAKVDGSERDDGALDRVSARNADAFFKGIAPS